MAYIAPTPAGQGHQGDWYVPVIGMGAGSIIGGGMQSLRSQWADTLRLLSGKASLPLEENLASMAGGINVGGKGGQVIRDIVQPVSEIEKLSPEEAMSYFGRAQRALDEGMYSVKARNFMSPHSGKLPPSAMGGAVPSPAIWDRVMNSGLRDEILGFGTQARP